MMSARVYIVCILLCSLNTRLNAQITPAPPKTEPLVVCTGEDANAPFAACEEDWKSDDFTGFDVEAFRKAAGLRDTPWIEGTDFVFKCVPFNEMLVDLVADNGTCLVGLGGITINQARRAQGMQFSYPTYRTNLASLVKGTSSNKEGWRFATAFSVDLWVACVCTVLAMPWIMFFLEYLSFQSRIKKSDVVPGWKESQWRAIWTSFNMEPFQVSSMAARFLAVVFGFFAVIIKEVLQSNLTAQLTVNSLNLPVTRVDQLVGKSVDTLPLYVDALKRDYNLQPEAQLLTEEAPEMWIRKLRAGTLTALIIDEPLAQYYANTAQGCDLRLAPFSIVPFDLGFAFSKNAPDEIIDEISDAILYMQEDGTLTRLRTSFIDVVNPECSRQLSAAEAVSWMDVYGLWILLGCAVAIAAIIVSISFFIRERKRRQQENAFRNKMMTRQATRLAHSQSIAANTASGDNAAYLGLTVVDSDSSDSDDDFDEEDDEEENEAAKHPHRLHHIPAAIHLGVAFKQKISMFGLHMAYNKKLIKLRDMQYAQRTADDAEQGGVLSAEEEPRGMKLVHALRDMCDQLEVTAGIRIEDPADIANLPRNESFGKKTRTVDDTLDEAPMMMRNQATGSFGMQSGQRDQRTINETVGE